MTQRSTPRLMAQRREASARYRLAKRIERPIDCECGKCKSCAARARYKREHADEWMEPRMPWPAAEYEPHMGSSLSTPDVPYRIVLRGRAGME